MSDYQVSKFRIYYSHLCALVIGTVMQFDYAHEKTMSVALYFVAYRNITRHAECLIYTTEWVPTGLGFIFSLQVFIKQANIYVHSMKLPRMI